MASHVIIISDLFDTKNVISILDMEEGDLHA